MPSGREFGTEICEKRATEDENKMYRMKDKGGKTDDMMTGEEEVDESV